MSAGARFLVLWAEPDDVAAFDRHYRDVHVPLAARLPGLRRYTLSRNLGATRGAELPYAIAELDFDDIAALRAALRSPEGQATADDVANLSARATVHSMSYELEDLLHGDDDSVRVALHTSVDLAAPADDVWELISDWAGMMRWWLNVEDGGLHGPTLVGCELIGEHGSVPRTRRMTLDDGSTVDETIIYQNDDTRRITYLKTDSARVRGYIATTYVDETDDARCTVHIDSAFDVANQADRTTTAAWFESIYAAMFNGYHRYFDQRRP